MKLLEGLTVAIVSTSTYKYSSDVHCMPLILLHSSIFVIIIMSWILLIMKDDDNEDDDESVSEDGSGDGD